MAGIALADTCRPETPFGAAQVAPLRHLPNHVSRAGRSWS